MKTNCQVCAKLGHVQSSSIAVKMEASASVLIGCVMELPTVWTNQMNKIVQVGFEFYLVSIVAYYLMLIKQKEKKAVR